MYSWIIGNHFGIWANMAKIGELCIVKSYGVMFDKNVLFKW